MTIAFTLMFIAALIGIAQNCTLSFLFRRENNRSSRKHTDRYATWAAMSCLLIILSACSGLTSSNEDVRPAITPLALTATPQSTAKPNIPATSSTNWTTYHADNQRTGYIPDTPDPHSLSKIWSKQLDGSV